MWVVAGVLLGVVVLAALAGFHAGPHAHAVSAVAGGAAAVWLVVMALTGDARPLLYVLLGADVTVSGTLGVTAYRALRGMPAGVGPVHDTKAIEGEMGVAVSDLDPTGVVRVRGEEWSAEAVNGPVRAGTAVQVLEVEGIRVRVWGEDTAPVLPRPSPDPAGGARAAEGRPAGKEEP